MANGIRSMTHLFDAGSRRPGHAKVLSDDGRAESESGHGSTESQAVLDEGLRLNRAFFSIRSARVRRAIIELMIEAGESEENPPFPLLN